MTIHALNSASLVSQKHLVFQSTCNFQWINKQKYKGFSKTERNNRQWIFFWWLFYGQFSPHLSQKHLTYDPRSGKWCANDNAFRIWSASYLFIFIFNLNNISPGRSHPSIQRGARPLTGDLPTTAPSQLTFEFWKLFPILSYCLWLYCQ